MIFLKLNKSNIAQTQVKVILKAPGMTPEEVESRVIKPIEMEMLGIPDQAILRSTAKYAIADITIDFVDGTDIYWARQQVAERRSEEHTSELQSLMRISYAVFCLKKKNQQR